MRLEQYLKASEARLKQAGIGLPRLDILILLEDALHKDRAWILAHPEFVLQGQTLKTMDKKLDRRAQQVPLAYIRGHTQFYGRKFRVNRHTLEPRPESETMIELLKQLAKSSKLKAESLKIADVGTGSGALGITAALEIPDSIVDLYDISASALAVAKHNAHLHELQLHARKMNLLSRPLRPYDVILANLPYLPDTWKMHPTITKEPRIALIGGKDGLDFYQNLFTQLRHFTWRPSFVLCESMPPQHEKLAQIAKGTDFKLLNTEDFIQVFTPL